MNVLVFAPHPDDDVLGCGGSILKHIKKKDTVTVVFLTNGDAGDLQVSKKILATIRKREAQAAANVLGVKKTLFLDFPDGYIEYSEKILIELVEHVRRIKPDIVYLPHANDAHRDHANTFLIATEAVLRAAANSYQECNGQPWYVSTILCYEIWTPLQKIQYTADISEHMEKKLQALQEHESQIKNLQYDEAILGLNRYRGIMTGKGTYCECFQVVRIGKL